MDVSVTHFAGASPKNELRLPHRDHRFRRRVQCTARTHNTVVNLRRHGSLPLAPYVVDAGYSSETSGRMASYTGKGVMSHFSHAIQKGRLEHAKGYHVFRPGR